MIPTALPADISELKLCQVVYSRFCSLDEGFELVFAALMKVLSSTEELHVWQCHVGSA